MIKTTENDRIIMDKVEKVICKYFNVTSYSLVDKDTSNNTSLARAFLFYILDDYYDIARPKICDCYMRTKRCLEYSISKMKYQIKMQKVYNNIYKELLDMLD